MREVVLHKDRQKKAKNFKVIGITNLLGKPICCIVIIEIKKELFTLGIALIFLRRKLEMIVTEKNNFYEIRI